jgi:DNA (cytosine-5)-methyltransferase 1
MSKFKIGSLFSGYGGLDLAVMKVLNAEVVWHCEYEEAPSKILKHHFPNVPNLGDVTKIDFSKVEPVDVLTGGFPCQDVSLVGKQAGLKRNTRSGLWHEFARAIETLKPRLVVIENVRGLLTVEADNGMEYTAEVLAEFGSRPVFTAIHAVLADLAAIGYDAKWISVRASDANAPHARFRIFIIGFTSNPDSAGLQRWTSPVNA